MRPELVKVLHPLVWAIAITALAGCSSTSGKGGGRTSSDGPPAYMKDVSTIPDAVPTPHTGAYKATPYTVLGKSYQPMQDGRSYREEGEASWYGTKFHGQATANGEEYDLYGMTAAHKTLPLPTYVQVTNLDNQRKIIVRVNDRGPFYSTRIIDLSYAAAKKLGFAERGVARVRVEGIDPVVWQQQNDPSYLVSDRSRSEAPTAAVAVPAPEEPVAWQQAPVVNTATASQGQYYLQVGAFSTDLAAQQLRQRLQGTVAAEVVVMPVQRETGTLHRVRVGPVASQDEAQRLIEQLRLANVADATLVSAN
jgi:rare lipoprotein A